MKTFDCVIRREEPKGYFVCDDYPEEFEAYEAGFPKKEKLKLPGQLG